MLATFVATPGFRYLSVIAPAFWAVCSVFATLSGEVLAAKSPPLSPGDRCTLSGPIKFTPLKKKAQTLAAGTELGVVENYKLKTVVSNGSVLGTVLTKDLTKQCVIKATPAPVTASASGKPTSSPSPAAPTSVPAAPPAAEPPGVQPPGVPATLHAESPIGVAGTLKERAETPEPEFEAPSGRSATLAYTAIDNGGGEGVDAVLEALNRRMPEVLASIGSFGTRSGAKVQRVLKSEGAGCEKTEACVQRLGRAFKADAVLFGTLAAKADGYHLEFRLAETKGGKITDRQVGVFQNRGLQPLIDDSVNLVRTAVRQLIIEEYGRLVLRINEPKALVSIDARPVGVSPIPPRPVPPGDHELNVELDGYSTFRQKVSVAPLEDVTLTLRLEHTEAWKARYKSEALVTRRWAWIALGTGLVSTAASVSLFVAGNITNQNAYNKYEKGGRALTIQELQKVASANSQVNTLDNFAIGTAVLAAAALGTSVILFLSGDDPHKYEHESKGPKLTFWPGGATVAGTF